jgi:Flp pilus assembly protein TadG
MLVQSNLQGSSLAYRMSDWLNFGKALLEKQAGGTLVEFAVASVLLFTVVFGILDCSRALYANHYVSYSAAEAARYAMVRGSTWNNAACSTIATESCTATSSNITTLVQSIAPVGIDASKNLTVSATWSGTTPTGAVCNAKGVNNSPGCVVQVKVTYNFGFVLPFLPSNALLMKSTAATVITQ